MADTETITAETTTTATTETKPAKTTTEAKPAKTEATSTTTTAETTTSDYDWRGAMAGEDKKFAKDLERYTDPAAFAKAFQENRARATDPRRLMIPGEDASDEDRAAYAKARKIPDDPKKYEITAKAPDGYEVTEADTARLEAITAMMHKRGGLYADPAVVNAVHELYYREQEEAQAIAQATAIRQAELTKVQLAKLWPGAEKDRNLTFAKSAASHFFGKSWDEIKDMQFVDGSLLGDNAQFIQAMAKVGRLTMEDPVFTEAGRNGSDPSKTLLDRKAAIMQLKYSDRKAYEEAAKDGGEIDQINEALARHEERVGLMQ
jgi:hypothetical protein